MNIKKESTFRFSVVIPVFNEEGNIGRVLDRLNAELLDSGEVIVVDDGSIDNTAAEIKKKDVIYIRHEENMGKGRALRTGMRIARSNCIVFIDGDGQDDPGDILRIVETVEGSADLVLGSRFLKLKDKNGISNKAVKPINLLGNKTLTWIINRLFGSSLTDTMASLRGYKADKLNSLILSTDRYEIETEMIIKCIKSNFKIAEISVERFERKHGISLLHDRFFGRFNFALRVLIVIMREKFFN